MTQEALDAALQRMASAGASLTAMAVFAQHFRQVAAGATGQIGEAEIEPVVDVPLAADLDLDPAVGAAALGRTAILRLNGGLGTSMGLDRAKTLLTVRDGRSFLDLIAGQVLAARRRWRVRLPVLFMNSFRTHEDTMNALAAHPELPTPGLPLGFRQNQVPKLRADDLSPVSWPADPALEWCPPGHGDLFTVLHEGGLATELVEQGYEYLCVANGDNLGASPDAAIAGWFAASGAPLAAEVCRRTPNDRKGGHPARRRSDGHLMIRDLVMCPEQDRDAFTDERRHPWFNTNTLWLHLPRVIDELDQRDGVLALPVIRNAKTVDPTDPTSTPVLQLESGMGTALGAFDGSAVIGVGRERFVPVKTTNELFLLRSDLYELDEDDRLVAAREALPTVWLDPRHFAQVRHFDARVPAVPSLRECEGLRVEGDWTFAPGAEVVGDVTLFDPGQPAIASGRLQ